MFSYINVGFVPYNEEMYPVSKSGGTVFYLYDEIDDFYVKWATIQLTPYTRGEILVKNFVYAIRDVDKLRTRQLKERIRNVLIAGK